MSTHATQKPAPVTDRVHEAINVPCETDNLIHRFNYLAQLVRVPCFDSFFDPFFAPLRPVLSSPGSLLPPGGLQ